MAHSLLKFEVIITRFEIQETEWSSQIFLFFPALFLARDKPQIVQPNKRIKFVFFNNLFMKERM